MKDVAEHYLAFLQSMSPFFFVLQFWLAALTETMGLSLRTLTFAHAFFGSRITKNNAAIIYHTSQ